MKHEDEIRWFLDSLVARQIDHSCRGLKTTSELETMIDTLQWVLNEGEYIEYGDGDIN